MPISTSRYVPLVLLAALLLPGTSVLAQTEIKVLGTGQAAGQVNELGHKLEIDWSSETIDVVETIVLSNTGRSGVEALYTFSLPAQAAISDLSIRDYKGKSTMVGLVAEHASIERIARPAPKATPDAGLLRMISSEGHGDDDVSRYELRVYPVPSKNSSIVTLRWQMPVRLVAGNYSIRLPNRGDDPVLSRSEVILNVPRTLGEVFASGNVLSEGRRAGNSTIYRYFAPVGDIVIQSKAAFTGAAHAEVALYPLSPSTGIAAIRVVVPEGARSVVPKFERALVVVDLSQSMDKAGRTAASELVDSVLQSIGTNVDVELITYNRESKRVLGAWQPADRKVRGRINRSIHSGALGSGSDLPAALLLGKASLGAVHKRKDRNLVFIVTDSVMPTTTKYSDLEASLGLSHIQESRVVAAVLVPSNEALPDMSGSPLTKLAQAGRGRVAVIRHGEAAVRGQRLLSELAQPAALEAIEVEMDRGVFIGDALSGTVGSGQSTAAFGYYKGGTPKRIWVEGMRANKRVKITAKRLPKNESEQLVKTVLATTSADAFPFSKSGDTHVGFLDAAKKLSVVTQLSALVAVDKKDGFALDRLALANKWGLQYYRRMPPPAERSNASFERFSYVAKDARGTTTKQGRRSGELPKSLVSRLIRAHIIPPVRNCYEGRLGREPNLAGSLSMHIEIVRGEVQVVKLLGIPHSLRPLKKCILDAAYAVPFPKTKAGISSDTIYVVNYPLRFRRVTRDSKGSVVPDNETTRDTSDPLYGLPE